VCDATWLRRRRKLAAKKSFNPQNQGLSLL
jgi:hypothetical protein